MWGLSYKLEKALELNHVVNGKLDVCNQHLDHNKLQMMALEIQNMKYVDLVRFLVDENRKVKAELLHKRWLDNKLEQHKSAPKNNTSSVPTSSPLKALPAPPISQVVSSTAGSTVVTTNASSYKSSDNSSMYHWVAHSFWAIALAWTWYRKCDQDKDHRDEMKLKDMQVDLAKLEKEQCGLIIENQNKKIMILDIFRSKLAVAGLLISFAQKVWSATHSKLEEANEMILALISKGEAEREAHQIQLMDYEYYYGWRITELLKILEIKNNIIKSNQSNWLSTIQNLQHEKNELKKKTEQLEHEAQAVSLKREKELRELLLLRQQQVFQYEFLQLNSDSAN